MLPRLRFVFAAALIAALPWILLGSGIITTAQNTPISEHPRAGSGVAVSAGDLRDAQHMHSLAYVRRSRELERLRELASSPLSEWVTAPAGMVIPEPAVAEPTTIESQIVEPKAIEPETVEPKTVELTVESTAAEPAGAESAAAEAAAAPAEMPPENTLPSPVASTPASPEPAPEPEPTVVASLPPEPTVPEPAAPAATPAVAELEMAAVPPIMPTRLPQRDPRISDNAESAYVDWSTIVPPLPRARTGEDQRNTTGRRQRLKRARTYRSEQIAPPDPFSGPPATAQVYDPGRVSGITR
jgi:hypothetical protein